WVSSRADCSFGPDHPPKFVTRSLRADEPRLAPADEITVGIAERPAGPITARAACRIGGAIALIDHVAGRRRIVARLAVGDRAADDGAGDDSGCHTRTDRA